MKVALKIALAVAVFVISYLTWPSFKYDVSCSSNDNRSDASAGCSAMITYDYSSYKIGGGLASLDNRLICYTDEAGDKSNCDVIRDESKKEADREYVFVTSQAVLGSLLIAIVFNFFLWLSQIVELAKRVAKR